MSEYSPGDMADNAAKGFASMDAEVAELVRQRDELLAALKGATAELYSILADINEDRMPHDVDEFHECLILASAAITKATKGEA